MVIMAALDSIGLMEKLAVAVAELVSVEAAHTMEIVAEKWSEVMGFIPQ
jgi:hypothetical protein